MTLFPMRPECWKDKYYQCPHCLNYGLAQNFGGVWVPKAYPASPALRAERQRLHDLFDPLWKNDANRNASRTGWYKYMSIGMRKGENYEFHFGHLCSFKECKRAENLIKKIYQKQGLKFPKTIV
jgi:hypothetical protein